MHDYTEFFIKTSTLILFDFYYVYDIMDSVIGGSGVNNHRSVILYCIFCPRKGMAIAMSYKEKYYIAVNTGKGYPLLNDTLTYTEYFNEAMVFYDTFPFLYTLKNMDSKRLQPLLRNR